jgi:hypothetical protein
MSLMISVIRPEDESKLPPLDMVPAIDSIDEATWRAASDKWFEQAQKAYLYWQPLGGDGIIYTFWSTIASQLWLTMLTALYQGGFSLRTPVELAQLERELNVLEAYWESHYFGAEPTSDVNSHEKERLREGMSCLREAIRIARDTGAKLSVS